MRRACVLMLLLCCGCGDDDSASSTDAAVDAGADAGRVERDAGPTCEAGCSTDQICCGSVAAPICIDYLTDPLNCGECERVCAEGLGVQCERGQCVCGFSKMGCNGTDQDYCCPPRTAGAMPYCADLDQDGDDCGACGNQCELSRASRCDGGQCVCGDTRSACDGTPTSTCCVDLGGEYSCVDTTTDRSHCGGCAMGCAIGETCDGSTCRSRMALDAGV